MKSRLLLCLFLLGFVSISYAGFPVERILTPTNILSENTLDDNTETEVLSSPAASLKSEKSKGIALILLLTLGLLAGHRWYLGRFWGWNVLFIMSLGGIGIWALADLIGIFAGWMKPVDGRYKKSFF